MYNSSKYLDEVFLLINKNIKTMIKIIALCLSIAIIYSLISDKYYQSSISLYPAGELSDDTTLMSSLIAQSTGMGDFYTPSYYIPDIIASRTLKESIILNEWIVDGKKTNLIDFWNIDNKPGFLSYLTSKTIDIDAINLDVAVNILDNLIIIDESTTGLISVYVYNQNAILAADIANYISDYVVSFVTLQQRKFASENKSFVESQLNTALNDLNYSEEKLTSFRKKHPITLDSPDLQLQRGRLLRDIEVNQEVYVTLRQQYEITKIDESKVRLLVNVLDLAKPSIKIAHPKYILIIFFGFFMGIATSIFYLFVIDFINKRKYN